MKIGDYQTHPASDAFRLMAGLEYEAFLADVKANKQREDIVLYKGKILDGRNRYRACIDLGIEPSFKTYEGDDPIGYVISANLQRRHQNESQRALSAARLATLPRGRRKSGKDAGLTQSEAAAKLNVGERNVRTAAAILKTAHGDVVSAVERGDITVAAAAELAKLPADQQLEQLAASLEADNKRARGAVIARGNKAKNDNEAPAHPELVLMKAAVRALELFGATIGRRAQHDGQLDQELAYAGHTFTLTLQLAASERAA